MLVDGRWQLPTGRTDDATLKAEEALKAKKEAQATEAAKKAADDAAFKATEETEAMEGDAADAAFKAKEETEELEAAKKAADEAASLKAEEEAERQSRPRRQTMPHSRPRSHEAYTAARYSQKAVKNTVDDAMFRAEEASKTRRAEEANDEWSCMIWKEEEAQEEAMKETSNIPSSSSMAWLGLGVEAVCKEAAKTDGVAWKTKEEASKTGEAEGAAASASSSSSSQLQPQQQQPTWAAPAVGDWLEVIDSNGNHLMVLDAVGQVFNLQVV